MTVAISLAIMRLSGYFLSIGCLIGLSSCHSAPLEVYMGKPSTPTDSSTSTSVAAASLAPGTYCFQAKTETLVANLRLVLAADDAVTGHGSGIIQHEQGDFYTVYDKTLSGRLDQSQLLLTVTTTIESDIQQVRDVWEMTPTALISPRQHYQRIPCAEQTALEGVIPRASISEAMATAITFAPGVSVTTVEDQVAMVGQDIYRLDGNAGQRMVLDLTSLNNNAVFDVLSPEGNLLTHGAVVADLPLAANGPYYVIVSSEHGESNYRLTVSRQ